MPCSYSDHEFVVLNFDESQCLRFGPGVWKFNNSLLSDQKYCDLISELISDHIAFKHVFSSVKDFWESLKDCIKRKTIEFSSAKRKELMRDQIRITNRLITLKNILVSGDPSVKNEMKELESSLNTLLQNQLEGIKI